MHRRTLLRGAAALVLSSPAAAPFARAAADPSPARRELVAAATTEPLVGMPYSHTPVLGFGGTVPGPEIRLRRGDALALDVVNRLDVPTSVHWHGVRALWAMDGVAGLTQAPVPPGGRFAVDFRPPDAGTYWYHAHANVPEQVGRGLYGPLIVEEESPITVDRELVWLLDDWRLAPDASIVDDFGNRHDGSHAGRIGNTVTVNGRGGDGRAWPHRVRAGERLRLRLINAANARQFALDFGTLPARVIAVDGQPVRPHAPDGPVAVPSAGRVDVVIDLPLTPSTTFEIVDRYYREPVAVGVPSQLSFLFAHDPAVMSAALGVVNRCISSPPPAAEHPFTRVPTLTDSRPPRRVPQLALRTGVDLAAPPLTGPVTPSRYPSSASLDHRPASNGEPSRTPTCTDPVRRARSPRSHRSIPSGTLRSSFLYPCFCNRL